MNLIQAMQVKYYNLGANVMLLKTLKRALLQQFFDATTTNFPAKIPDLTISEYIFYFSIFKQSKNCCCCLDIATIKLNNLKNSLSID